MNNTSQSEKAPTPKRTGQAQAEQLLSFARSVQPPSPQTDFSQLDERRISLDNPPPQPVPVYTLAGHRIATAGNITAVSAPPKGGKTAVAGGMVASVAYSYGWEEIDFWGCDFFTFSAAPHEGKAVILFDTEQSRYDSYLLVKRAAKRAGRGDLPPNFRFFSTADLGTEKRRAYLAAELERANAACGGIHSVFIDGIADLCIDPNDAIEAFGLVEELVQLAIKYDCPIIVVLHENPSGAETGKTRGHLGSQLERKAESNLRVMKDANGISTIFSERCRSASIPKNMGPRFRWDDEARMHITVHTEAKADKAEEKRKDCQPAVDAVFAGTSGNLKWSDLKQRMMEVVRLTERTAERRIKDWMALGLITISISGEYCKK
jgi:hypothetical protein